MFVIKGLKKINKLILVMILGFLFTAGGCTGRLEQKLMDDFFASLGNTSITVYPAYIKRHAIDASGKPLGYDSDDSGYDLVETERLAEFIRCESLAEVTVSSEEVPLDRKWQRTQSGLMQASALAFGEYVAAHPINTEYAMMAEYLIHFDKVWAVHTYVVNARGEVVWLLHLNEHFDVLTRIEPHTPHDGTNVLLNYLRTGWPKVPYVTSIPGTDSPKIQAGVFDDFEAELPSGTDEHGISLGFLTFNGPKSTASISRVTAHPPLPGEREGNNVLQLDMNVKDWAGVVHTFENEAVDTWTPLDWSSLGGFRFWLYGNNSGAELFVHVMDNRTRCATNDTAERYGYEFIDNFSGWKQITVNFPDMARAEIYNRAPNDGFGLNEVHGWGFGTANKGQATYYLDDFELLTKPDSGVDGR